MIAYLGVIVSGLSLLLAADVGTYAQHVSTLTGLPAIGILFVIFSPAECLYLIVGRSQLHMLRKL